MKIFLIIDTLAGGGAEKIISILANKLSKKHQIVLCQSMGDKICHQLDKNITLTSLKQRTNRSYASHILSKGIYIFFYLLYKTKISTIPPQHTCHILNYIEPYTSILKSEKPDLIISFLLNTNVICLLGKCIYKIDIPLICAARNGIENEIRSLPLSFYYQLFLGRFYNNCDYYIATTKDEAREANNKYGIHPYKITTIFNGIDVENILRKSYETIPQQHEKLFKNDDYKIITVGRLTKQKNHKLLLKTIKLLSQYHNISLYIIGEGDLYEELCNIAIQLQLTKRIHFLGWQFNPYKYIKRSDLLVLTSLWEGCPNILLEAMALNIPTLATPSSESVKYLMNIYRNGYLCSFDEQSLCDKIVEISNRSQSDTSPQYNLKILRKFTINSMMYHYDNIIKKFM